MSVWGHGPEGIASHFLGAGDEANWSDKGWRRLHPSEESSDNCGEDDSCVEADAFASLPWLGLLICGGMFAVIYILFRICCCCRSEPQPGVAGAGRFYLPNRGWSIREVALVIAEAVFIAAFWVPMLLLFLCCYSGDDSSATYERHRRAYDAWIHESVDRAARLREQQTSESWRRRGWLVMMRTRNRGSFARRPESWLVRFGRCFRRPLDLPRSTAMVNPKSTVSDIELLEFGRRWETNFVGAVVKLVEIEEEGLFRQVVTYI